METASQRHHQKLATDCILSCFHRYADSADSEPDTDTSKKRDRSLLSRREEARLSEIFQKGYTLKQVSPSSSKAPASNLPDEQESAEADLVPPFVDSQDFSAAEMQQVYLQDTGTFIKLCQFQKALLLSAHRSLSRQTR